MTDFENIYNQYFRDIYIFMYSLCRNETLAEEITQETFFKAMQSIDSFKGHCKINVWLCQIAKNTYFSYLNKQKWIDSEKVTEKASNDNIEEALLNKDDVLQIHRILHQMKEPYKEVFTLRIFGELSFAQIGQLFGKTESWARVTHYRAKQKIQSIQEEETRNGYNSM